MNNKLIIYEKLTIAREVKTIFDNVT